MRRQRQISPKFTWRPVDAAIEAHVQRVLDSWVGTPYRDGQQVKGVGTDCVRFVVATIDELFGRPCQPIPKLPGDACLHDRASAMRVMRIILEKYQPMEEVVNGTLEPGDVLVVGPPRGGPGHAMFAGARRNTIYQATTAGVHQCGLSFPPHYCKLFHVFRATEKEKWIQ